MIVTTRPERVAVVSRRRFFRVDVDLECELDGKRGRVLNLSGSGMLLQISAAEIKESSTVDIRIGLPEGWVPVTARVIRLQTAQERQTAGVHFTKLSQGVREAMIRYVTAQQRSLMRLGLLVRDEQPSAETLLR